MPRNRPFRKQGDRFPWEIHKAAGSGNVKQLQSILESGANVNTRYGDSEDPVLIATAREDRPKTAHMLIHNGADVNLSNRNGWTPIMTASWWNSPNVCQNLLEAGADCLLTNSVGLTSLHMSARAGNTDILQVLLESGASPDLQDELGWTPLHFAAFSGRLAVVELLVKHSATVDCFNERHETPLMLCAFEGHHKIVQTFLDHKASVKKRNKDGETVLHYVVRSLIPETEKLNLLELLKKFKASVNSQDRLGLSALMKSAKLNLVKVTTFLLQSGANVDLLSKQYFSALDYAAMTWNPLSKKDEGYLQIMNLLLSHKIQFYVDDKRDNLGRTSFSKLKSTKEALLQSCRLGLLDLARCLMSKHVYVDINYRDKKGNSALMTAAHCGQLELVQELVDIGANISLKDNEGNTCLMRAVMAPQEVYMNRKQDLIINLLLDAGADPTEKNKYYQTACLIAVNNKYADLAEIFEDY